MADRDPETGQFLKGHALAGPGRPSLYDPAMNDQVTKLALLGMTDEEMAQFFGIDTSTYYRWLEEYPAFREAAYAGKEIADAEVATSLYRRATGEHVEAEAVRKDNEGNPVVIKYKQFIPADPGAAFNWLKNRQGKRWRDKQGLDVSGSVDVNHGTTSAAEKLAALLSSKTS